MEKLLVKLMVIAALAQLGLNVGSLAHCHSGQCAQAIEKRSRNIMKINGKPLSMFPEEAKRFR
jgi:hypothetical protein